MCVCGNVQTERHVVEACPMTAQIRNVYNIRSLEDIFAAEYPNEMVCKLLYDILHVFN